MIAVNHRIKCVNWDITLTPTKRWSSTKISPQNPVVVVTGASRGIGRAIAIALGEAGCKVIVNYANNDAAALVVCDSINALARGGQGIPMKADISNQEAVKAMFAKIKAEHGSVDVLVNNAGITKDCHSISMKPKDFMDVMDINLYGAFYCSQAVINSSFLRQKRGRIVNIASIVGQIGNPGQVNYAASKGALLAMTKTMSKEFGSRNITINAICPGFIESDMTKNLQQETLIGQIPLGRLGKPEEVAGLVKYLALDPSAAYITGHTFNIDGGLAIGAT